MAVMSPDFNPNEKPAIKMGTYIKLEYMLLIPPFI
jgi:hypothetical protein